MTKAHRERHALRMEKKNAKAIAQGKKVKVYYK